MTKILYRIARFLPAPIEISMPLDWGHGFMTILPFVVLEAPGAELDHPCEIAHENTHTIFALLMIGLGFVVASWKGALGGLVLYGLSNAFERLPFEVAAERVEQLCIEEN